MTLDIVQGRRKRKKKAHNLLHMRKKKGHFCSDYCAWPCHFWHGPCQPSGVFGKNGWHDMARPWYFRHGPCQLSGTL